MGDQFSSYVSNYLSSNTDVSFESIKDKMQRIQKGVQANALSTNSSVFSFNGEVTQEQLTTFINSASNVSLDDEVATLFSILDKDGTGTLTDEELSVLRRRDGSIDSFSFWSKTYIPATASSAGSANTGADSNAGNSPVNSTNSQDTTGARKLTDKEISSIAQKIANNQDKLENYYGKVSLEDYMKLHNQVEKLINSESGSIPVSQPDAGSVPTNTTPPLVQSTPPESAPESMPGSVPGSIPGSMPAASSLDKYVEDINAAFKAKPVDKAALKSIVFNDNLTDNDFVSILKNYEQKYGTAAFTRNADTSVTGDDVDKEILEKVAVRLTNLANKGDIEAINLLSEEIKGSIVGFGTVDYFLEPVIDKLTPEAIKQINVKYQEIAGENLYDAVKGEYWLPNYHGSSAKFQKIKDAIK